jgi:hypothetical protein
MAPVLVLTLSIHASVLAFCFERFCSGAFCPAGLFATLVPEAIQDSLTVDFARDRKIPPGDIFRMGVFTGQDLPLGRQYLPGAGIFCRV